MPLFQKLSILEVRFYCLIILLLTTLALGAQSIDVKVLLKEKQQTIDGFGAHQGNAEVGQNWWIQLYYDDLQASIYRIDLTARLKTPYSDLSYYSPWFMGSQVNSVFNLEDNNNPNGPENNRVRTYTGPNDYSRSFGGRNAPIAVMGPDIDENVKYFSYTSERAIAEGKARRKALGDFKLIGSFWSPLPWVKVSSGNNYAQNWWPGPVGGTPWPFVWAGNFAGGRLDVSGTPLAVFDDAAMGGGGPTSSLTQFARSAAAYVRGFQNFHQVKFYTISIQNELNFEQFYNSATYPLSSQYITALKEVRREFDKYEDLKDIRLIGPEDLLGGDAYGMWQYGGGANTVHKNLQYLANVAADPDALAALDFFCIHGYGSDGVSASGATSTLWDWWVNGWGPSPAPGIPGNVKGFITFNKKSWMTETSGENAAWLSPSAGFPSDGAWGLALRIHQALTTGRQSAWIYWTFTESDDNGGVTPFALSNQTQGANAPKYVAAKHFFRFIRPNAVRVNTSTTASAEVLASAYTHEADETLTIVLLNTASSLRSVQLEIPDALTSSFQLNSFTSSNNSYWQNDVSSFQGKKSTVAVPGYGVVTLTGKGVLTTAVENHTQNWNPVVWSVEPNPFRTQTFIRFFLDQPTFIRISVLDRQGRIVQNLLEERKAAGGHIIPFEAGALSAGVYFCRIKAEGFENTQKLVVVK